MLDQKHRRFEDYLPREGFTEIELTSEKFRAILSDLVPVSEWPDDVIDAVVDEVSDHLARAVGQFGWSPFDTRRQKLRERLNLLRDSLKTAAYILASSGHLREKIDIDLMGFMTNVALVAEPGLTLIAATRKYATAHEQIEDILKDIEAAQIVMEQSSADGPARRVWYDSVVAGAVLAAQSLGIPLAMGGDRDDNPYDTPFVRLVMGLESLLPSETQSPSMAACSKRIERSRAWPQNTSRQNLKLAP